VNRFLLLLIATLLLPCALRAGEKKHFVLYATLNTETRVEMADGSHWIMDKGDTFPVIMFKEHQTKAILQLAGTSFWVDTDRLKLVEEKQITPEQLATYRHNVETYISKRASQWTEQASRKK